MYCIHAARRLTFKLCPNTYLMNREAHDPTAPSSHPHRYQCPSRTYIIAYQHAQHAASITNTLLHTCCTSTHILIIPQYIPYEPRSTQPKSAVIPSSLLSVPIMHLHHRIATCLTRSINYYHSSAYILHVDSHSNYAPIHTL